MELHLISNNDTGLNQEALDEFIEQRKELKKPMTKLAIKKAANLLMKHSFDHQQYMVDRAIVSGWTGLWDVEPQKKATTRATSIEDKLTDDGWAG